MEQRGGGGRRADYYDDDDRRRRRYDDDDGGGDGGYRQHQRGYDGVDDGPGRRRYDDSPRGRRSSRSRSRSRSPDRFDGRDGRNGRGDDGAPWRVVHHPSVRRRPSVRPSPMGAPTIGCCPQRPHDLYSRGGSGAASHTKAEPTGASADEEDPVEEDAEAKAMREMMGFSAFDSDGWEKRDDPLQNGGSEEEGDAQVPPVHESQRGVQSTARERLSTRWSCIAQHWVLAAVRRGRHKESGTARPPGAAASVVCRDAEVR